MHVVVQRFLYWSAVMIFAIAIGQFVKMNQRIDQLRADVDRLAKIVGASQPAADLSRVHSPPAPLDAAGFTGRHSSLDRRPSQGKREDRP